MGTIQRLYQTVVTKWGKEWGRRDFTISSTTYLHCSDSEKCGKSKKAEAQKCVKRKPCVKYRKEDRINLCPKENPCSFLDSSGRPKRKAPPQSPECNAKCKQEAAKKAARKK